MAKRADGKTLQEFEIRATLGVQIASDVKQALNALKPTVALFVGGMGAKEKNYHKDAMVDRGYAGAAERIQELFLAGHKDRGGSRCP